MSRRDDDETYELEDVVLDVKTDKAILVRDADTDPEDAEEDEDKWWIPKSVVVATCLERIGDEGWVEVPLWWAEQKGLV